MLLSAYYWYNGKEPCFRDFNDFISCDKYVSANVQIRGLVVLFGFLVKYQPNLFQLLLFLDF